MAKKGSLVSGNWPNENTFSSLTRPHSKMHLRIYIFLFETKTHTHKQKAKETKENRKTKETKKETEKVNLVSVNNICRKCNVIQWYCLTICSVLLNYVISQQRMLKSNKFSKTFAHICLLYIQDENQDMLMQWKFLHLHIPFSLTFQLLLLKRSNFVPFRLLRRHCLKHFR